MSGRITRDILDILVNPRNSRFQNSSRNEVLNNLHRLDHSSPRDLRDVYNPYEAPDSVRRIGERDRDMDRERSHGRPSRFRDMYQSKEMRRDCGFEPEEEPDYGDYGDYRNVKRRYSRRTEYSPERCKKPLLPPPAPRFRRAGFKYMDILELFEKSNRNHREKGIAILVRGPPGSGKTHISKLIMEKEQSMGNYKIIFFTPSDSYASASGELALAKHREEFMKNVEETMKQNLSKFYVIEMESASIQNLKKVLHIATEIGNVTCYLIELQQPGDICVKYGSQRRKLSDVNEVIETISKEPPPGNVQLIDAKSIFRKDYMKEKMIEIVKNSVDARNYTSDRHNILSRTERIDNPYLIMKSTDNVTDLAAHVTELMKDPEILQLIQLSMSNMSLNSSKITSAHYNALPTLTAKMLIDYDHQPLTTLEDILFTFCPRKVIDYNHRSSQQLKDFVAEIDIEEIVAKRRVAERREKVLWYLATAEKPEETASNPNYPGNWKIISKYRPKPIGKRKKKATRKIQTFLNIHNRKKIFKHK